MISNVTIEGSTLSTASPFPTASASKREGNSQLAIPFWLADSSCFAAASHSACLRSVCCSDSCFSNANNITVGFLFRRPALAADFAFHFIVLLGFLFIFLQRCFRISFYTFVRFRVFFGFLFCFCCFSVLAALHAK